MALQRFGAHQIKQPIQLTAGLVVLVIALLASAAIVTSPPWLPAVLAVSGAILALAYVPVILLLQTRFRPQILEDKYYVQHLKLTLERGSREVQKSLGAAGLDVEALVSGRSVRDVGAKNQRAIRSVIDKYEDPLLRLEAAGSVLQETDSAVLLEYGKALLASQEWKRATTYLDAYVMKKPSDWNGHFLRGVAHANKEGGPEADTASVTAYTAAILLAPSDLDPNRRARFLSYRAAMFKRLNRFNEALEDLARAQRLASNYYEAHDIKYNLACIYAMQEDREKLFDVLAQLNSAPSELARIKMHANDYFKKFRNDPEFLAAIEHSAPQQ